MGAGGPGCRPGVSTVPRSRCSAPVAGFGDNIARRTVGGAGAARSDGRILDGSRARAPLLVEDGSCTIGSSKPLRQVASAVCCRCRSHLATLRPIGPPSVIDGVTWRTLPRRSTEARFPDRLRLLLDCRPWPLACWGESSRPVRRSGPGESRARFTGDTGVELRRWRAPAARVATAPRLHRRRVEDRAAASVREAQRWRRLGAGR